LNPPPSVLSCAPVLIRSFQLAGSRLCPAILHRSRAQCFSKRRRPKQAHKRESSVPTPDQPPFCFRFSLSLIRLFNAIVLPQHPRLPCSPCWIFACGLLTFLPSSSVSQTKLTQRPPAFLRAFQFSSKDLLLCVLSGVIPDVRQYSGPVGLGASTVLVTSTPLFLCRKLGFSFFLRLTSYFACPILPPHLTSCVCLGFPGGHPDERESMFDFPPPPPDKPPLPTSPALRSCSDVRSYLRMKELDFVLHQIRSPVSHIPSRFLALKILFHLPNLSGVLLALGLRAVYVAM